MEVDNEESLSLSDDLEDLSNDDIACHHHLIVQVDDGLPQDQSADEDDRMRAPRTPADGGSASIEIVSLNDDGEAGREAQDLEIDYISSDPPAYDSLAHDASPTTTDSLVSGRLNQELHGPSAMPPVSSSRHTRTDAASSTAPTPNRQQRRSRGSGTSESVRTQPRREVKQVRVGADARAVESCPPAVELTKTSDVVVNLNSSRTSRSRRSRTSSNSSSVVKTDSSKRKASDGTVSLAKYPGGTCVTTKGPGSVSLTVTGNVTINNHIDLRTQVTQSKTTVKPAKAKAKRRPIPAQNSKRRIQQTDIEILSGLLGDQWFRIGLSIGVDKGVLENIRVKHNADQQEMTRQMFFKWTHKFGRKATINYVIDALTDDKFALYDVAEKLPAD